MTAPSRTHPNPRSRRLIKMISFAGHLMATVRGPVRRGHG